MSSTNNTNTNTNTNTNRKPITKIIEDIKKLLEKHDELSVRQISLKINSQWRTAKKALDTMESLGIVKQRNNPDTDRLERLYRVG